MASPSSAGTDDDLAHLDHVYHALMATLLDSGAVAPSEPVAADADAEGGVKNAKRRKMDKKRAKREEQKRVAEETVDSVEFKLFSRNPVTLVSLLPAEEPTWTTRNPRHVPLTEGETLALRHGIASVVVDGTQVLSSAGGNLRPVPSGRVVTSSEIPEPMIHLHIPRPLPAFSATYMATHPTYVSPPTTTQGKKHPHPPATAGSNAATDPLRTALTKTRAQKRARVAVHVVFTANGKVQPWTTKRQTGTPVPAVTVAGLRRDEKAHARRIERRTHRLSHTPPDPIHQPTPTTGKPPPKPSGAWTNPRIPPARFWAAPAECGGKSGGYAYGFAGSGVGVRERVGRAGGAWVRDRMR